MIEKFPIVCWQVSPELVLGQVIGQDIQVAEKSSNHVRQAVNETLAKAARKGDVLYPPDIVDPVLTIHKVEILLNHKSKRKTYPLPVATKFDIAAVHSRTINGFGECYLPFLNQSFFYYEENQLRSLIRHFSIELLTQMTPEEAIQFAMPSEPWIEVATVKSERTNTYWEVNSNTENKFLQTLADALPIPKKVLQKNNRLPQVAWERGEIIDLLSNKFLQEPSNCLVLGEQGVGKSCILQEAIRVASRQGRSAEVSAPTFWRTTPQRLIGKAKYLGEWQAICDEAVAALASCKGIVWFDDLISLIFEGGEGVEDSMAAYLLPALRKGNFRIIGEVRPREYELLRQKFPAFLQVFDVITLDELSSRQARKVFFAYANYVETNHSITTTKNASELLLQLVQRYIKYEKTPGNFVRFFGECIKYAHEQQLQVLDEREIIDRFIAFTGLPEILICDDLPLTEDEVMPFFKSRIIGQDEVLKHLVHTVLLFKAGLNDPQKPIATLLFAGPTGVGKTAATKALTEFFFKSGQTSNPLIRLDMSEFQHPYQIEKLIGGGKKPSKLIQHVRNQPFSVVLLDEIEKADDSVFDTLLATLDEGILTDRFGRVTDFRNTIIVMTSNLGVTTSSSIGFSQEESSNAVTEAGIRQFFRPEFFNRIDRVLYFKPLEIDSIRKIAERELGLISERDRIIESGIELSFSDALIDFIAQVGFSPKYGARPIQRAIEQYVVAELAQLLLNESEIKSLHMNYASKKVVAEKNIGPHQSTV